MRNEPPYVIRAIGLAAFVALPVLFVGGYTGFYTIQIGANPDIVIIFVRAIACAVCPVLIALFVSRYWLLPALTYCYGFLGGYGIGDFLGAGIPAEAGSPELPWLIVFAVWATCFTAFLRKHYLSGNLKSLLA